MHVIAITEADGSTTQLHVRLRANLPAAAERELRRATAATRRRVLDTLVASPTALRDVPIGTGRTLTVVTGTDPAVVRRGDPWESRDFMFGSNPPQRAATTPAEPGKGHTLDGYAVVWDYTYPISDRHGDYLEQFKRGAFSESIDKRTPIAQYDHGMHPMVGSIPVATWHTIREDQRGLRLIGTMAESWLTMPVRTAIQDGRVNGMSIRFAVTRENWSKQRDRRTITGADLFEAGPVAMPASAATTISLREGTRTAAQRRALALSLRTAR